MKGRGTTMGVKCCSEAINQFISENEEVTILKGDFKNFFMSIDKRLLYKRICSLLDKYEQWDAQTELAWKSLIYKVVFNNPKRNCIIVGTRKEFEALIYGKSLFHCDEWHGLPIGNLTSQLFANLFLSDFDWFVVNELGFKNYGRYVDDFYIVDKNKKLLLEAIPKINDYLSTIGITLHPKKVSLTNGSQGVEFLGAIIKPNRILVGTRTKTNFWKKIRRLNDDIEKKIPTLEETNQICSSVNSYVGFFRQFNSYNLRKKWLTEKNIGNLSGHLYINKEKTKFLVDKNNFQKS